MVDYAIDTINLPDIFSFCSKQMDTLFISKLNYDNIINCPLSLSMPLWQYYNNKH